MRNAALPRCAERSIEVFKLLLISTDKVVDLILGDAAPVEIDRRQTSWCTLSSLWIDKSMNRLLFGMGTFALVLAATQSGIPRQHAPSSSRPSGDDESQYGHRVVAPGLTHFIEVTPMLFRGGRPTDVGLETLAGMGIGIVIDGGGFHRHERHEATRLGMQYVAIPWHCPFPRDHTFVQFLSLVRHNPNKKIFVHCRLGDDRVGMMIAAYRMAVDHWTAEQAMGEMKANGFAFWHHLICPGLAAYEKQFPARYKANPAFHAP